MNYGLLGAIGGLGQGLSDMGKMGMEDLKQQRLAEFKQKLEESSWKNRTQEERRYQEGQKEAERARTKAEDAEKIKRETTYSPLKVGDQTVPNQYMNGAGKVIDTTPRSDPMAGIYARDELSRTKEQARLERAEAMDAWKAKGEVLNKKIDLLAQQYRAANAAGDTKQAAEIAKQQEQLLQTVNEHAQRVPGMGAAPGPAAQSRAGSGGKVPGIGESFKYNGESITRVPPGTQGARKGFLGDGTEIYVVPATGKTDDGKPKAPPTVEKAPSPISGATDKPVALPEDKPAPMPQVIAKPKSRSLLEIAQAGQKTIVDTGEALEAAYQKNRGDASATAAWLKNEVSKDPSFIERMKTSSQKEMAKSLMNMRQ